MSNVAIDISMSLDGFVTASGVRPDEPLGDGGERLHTWAFGADSRDRDVLERGSAGTGAVVAGRRTFDYSLPWWGADGPSGAARVPVFVVSHSVPERLPDGGVYTFVTDGIEAAVERARGAAGGGDVSVMGGADIVRQVLAGGLADEVSIHLVPVVFGGGTRLFGPLDGGHVHLEPVESVTTPAATHVRYRIVG
ncbi:dihydrofolate reductase family protein [Streptomyces sp. PT12]|uniref:dihydrofolate reductase family protein n=1 Tax=Streptomyces sp. PT12 TaxID=1510197 RepID=UPI000DE39331|nr:dihydrofolate reductase family protein [Streptomyces sp. PT12]RBM04700.1 deaminase [Streptomyces sp. PT12]